MENADKYQQTRQLLSIVGNQSNGIIQQDEAKIAQQKLDQSTPDTTGAKTIIDKLRSNEMHPALRDAVNKAAYEVATPPSEAQRSRPRM
ncbi:hypothetical protein [Halomonas campaniensis]|uniref:Uncharacterized protein n=1 Tax=Halomonas campaniensis TaxID=213554 RepID=A0A246S638_9GAMM|nr:hypothetical protein [Halomonas campaniensis]OWV31238.1 hypothetical protein JI62_02485 [Halomonas campaniensis]